MKEFENVEAELRRHVEDLQKKYHDARAEIDTYQQRSVSQLSRYVPRLGWRLTDTTGQLTYALTRDIDTAILSVRPSVCLSVTFRY